MPASQTQQPSQSGLFSPQSYGLAFYTLDNQHLPVKAHQKQREQHGSLQEQASSAG
jgi:hypothetical protein